MMKDTKTEKDKLHRYLDDLYTRDDASQLLQSIKDSENQDILDELAAEVWEESGNLQPGNDLEREKYKREARQLLKRIEHKKSYMVPPGFCGGSQYSGCNSHYHRECQLFPVYE